jgi:hypothetical protein
MNNTLLPREYVNDLIYELEKAFWDERGKGARFRTTTIGREYFINKVRPLLNSEELAQIFRTIEDVLKGDGIVAKLSYEIEERLVTVQVESCIHVDVEEKMISKDIEPFTCVPANLIALAIEEKLNIPVELAEIKVKDGTCQLLFALFEKQFELK